MEKVFDQTSIVQSTAEFLTRHFRQHYVLTLTFEPLSDTNPFFSEWLGSRIFELINVDKVRQTIISLVSDSTLQETAISALPPSDQEQFREYTATPTKLMEHLEWVMDRFFLGMRNATQHPVVIIVDDYDRPLNRAWATDKFEKIRDEICRLLNIFDLDPFVLPRFHEKNHFYSPATSYFTILSDGC